MAGVARDNQEGSFRKNQSRNSTGPAENEKYISQLLEEIEGMLTKKLSQQISRTKSRILGVLSKLDKVLLNPQVPEQSGTVRGASWNMNEENQEPTADCSQNDLRLDVDAFIYRSAQSMDSDPEEISYTIDHSL